MASPLILLPLNYCAQFFVCVAALAILNRLDFVVVDTLVTGWLSEQLLPSGGLNGRTEKLEDMSVFISSKTRLWEKKKHSTSWPWI